MTLSMVHTVVVVLGLRQLLVAALTIISALIGELRKSAATLRLFDSFLLSHRDLYLSHRFSQYDAHSHFKNKSTVDIQNAYLVQGS